MTASPIARRSWRSFIDAQSPGTPRTVGRGRAGHTLWQRVKASVLGFDLPVRPAPTAAPRTPGTVPRQSAGEGSRNQQPDVRPALGWFELPALSPGGALTAAGGDAVVLETAGPDGRVTFLVRSVGVGEPSYSLELVLRDDDVRPLMCQIRYARPDGRMRELLVPVVRGPVGPAASYVRLPGFSIGAAWTASVAIPVGPESDWDTDTVTASIEATLNEATREAWRRVRERVGDGLRGVIDDALR
ncbi:hypothetical protein [Streptomyces sp. NRRL B-3229]|uniref:hypothetical protein n=1 Tax=Streptomyces sp. NRRL B-3229 TaxID=1463836 RepID=UPI0004C1803D|nr:hypothetical protein [Streptomyces sp. NRRL B-3229]